MKRHFSSFVAVTSILLASISTAPPSAAQSLTASEAQAIATDAYVYFYPLVTMDLTRKQLINSDPKTAGIGGPANTFDNIGIPGRRYESGGPAEFRHAVFERLARPDA